MTTEQKNVLRRIDDFAKDYFDPWDYEDGGFVHDDNFVEEYADGLAQCPREWILELDFTGEEEMKIRLLAIIDDLEKLGM